MNKHLTPLDLHGSLKVNLNHFPIEIECEGQSIRLTFTSVRALKQFFDFNRSIRKQRVVPFIQDQMQQFNWTYYLGPHLIGESRPDLHPTWFGELIGLARSKFYISSFLKHFLS